MLAPVLSLALLLQAPSRFVVARDSVFALTHARVIDGTGEARQAVTQALVKEFVK